MWPFNIKRKYIQSLGREHQYTPDMHLLEDSPKKLVFLCDDMEGRHQIEKHCQYVARGFTVRPFDYRVSRFGRKAVPFAVGRDAPGGLKVKGKIYAIDSHAIPRLDTHYRNGVEFARVRTHVIVTDRDHRIMSIGSEEFLKHLPPGMIRTVPELGIRHYTSNPMAGVVGCRMYVAMRTHWEFEDFNVLPRATPVFPKDNLVWLPKYYRYPFKE